jgi:hypothetical protein
MLKKGKAEWFLRRDKNWPKEEKKKRFCHVY